MAAMGKGGERFALIIIDQRRAASVATPARF
jgi:hypothetical protein